MFSRTCVLTDKISILSTSAFKKHSLLCTNRSFSKVLLYNKTQFWHRFAGPVGQWRCQKSDNCDPFSATTVYLVPALVLRRRRPVHSVALRHGTPVLKGNLSCLGGWPVFAKPAVVKKVIAALLPITDQYHCKSLLTN